MLIFNIRIEILFNYLYLLLWHLCISLIKLSSQKDVAPDCRQPVLTARLCFIWQLFLSDMSYTYLGADYFRRVHAATIGSLIVVIWVGAEPSGSLFLVFHC